MKHLVEHKSLLITDYLHREEKKVRFNKKCCKDGRGEKSRAEHCISFQGESNNNKHEKIENKVYELSFNCP